MDLQLHHYLLISVLGVICGVINVMAGGGSNIILPVLMMMGYPAQVANATNRPTIGIYTDSNPAKTGVQESPWAVNLGGIGQPPSVNEVFNALQRCLQNKEAA